MEEDQERKYVCKLCNMSFCSGKSLGGHMRGHITSNSTETEEKLKDCSMGFESSGQSSYGLRENPKKSWKFSDSKNKNLTPKQENLCKICGKGFYSLRALSGHMRSHSRGEGEENLCKECGKGFLSMKALFGHMRCHSEKYRASIESWTGSDQKPVIDSQSDNETAGLVRRKRSKRGRYKITAATPPFSSLNSSSSVSEIERELQEGAMCLMMLSRGMGNWGRFKSVSEYCDTNSLIVEAKLLHRNEQITENEGTNIDSNGDGALRTKKPRKKRSDSCVPDAGLRLFEKEISGFGGLDSGSASDEEEKEVELEVSMDRFLKGGDSDEFEKPKLVDESGFELYNTEIEEEFSNAMKIKLTEAELDEDLMTEGAVDRADSESTKSSSSKKARLDAYDPELGQNCCTKIKYAASDSETFDNSQKEDKYTCRTCSKSFDSPQALGGHRSSRKTVKTCFASKIHSCKKGIQTNCKMDKVECNESSIEQEVGGRTVNGYESNKRRAHECSICFKVFRSGQALGGHKRAHFLANSATSVQETILIKQEISEVCDDFDLNIPAALEEEAIDNVGFQQLWIGSNQKPEPLVGLISS